VGGLLLAVETATPLTSVALLEGDTPVCELVGERGRPTAEVLLPAIDALLREAGVALSEVSAFAVSIGPGSFTSLRIGLATVKGLAFGSSRLAVGVPTLAALALGAPEGKGPTVAMLDARRDEVYAASYQAGGCEEGQLPCSVYRADELAALLPPACLLAGEGAGILGEELASVLGEAVRVFPEVEPRAAHVGRLAAAALARGEGVDPAALVPRYLRRAQAEVVRTGQALE
jgi:tRNA threonylcarbamoyladenosine biosynthesis protein TsaB